MKLSIVATLYQSAPYIHEFCQRASSAAQQLAGDDYEIILVNDGSPDNSLDIAVTLTKTNSHLTVIDLSRNFGHHKAMMTGLAHAKGDKVFLIDSDLEEEPEWLLSFSRQMEEEQCDVVYGVQETRKGNLFERFSGLCFYAVFNLLSDIQIPKNLLTVRLMSRRYVDELLKYGESQMQFSVISELAGFKKIGVKCKKHASSPTTYSLRRKLSYLLNAITSSSSKPLYYIFLIGLFITLFSFAYIAYAVLQSFLYDSVLSGWTSLIVSIWLIGGLNFMFIGTIGLYVAKVFVETKSRPYVHIRKIWREE